MTRDELERILQEQGQGKAKSPVFNRETLRLALNVIFMVAGAAGVVCYFYADERTGMYIVAASLVVKVIEFLVRYLL